MKIQSLPRREWVVLLLLAVGILFAQHGRPLYAAQEDGAPLLTPADLFCSFLVMDMERLDLRITGAEAGIERILLKENDRVYMNKGLESGLAEGQTFTILAPGPAFKPFGRLAFKRGWVRVVQVKDSRSTGEIVQACGEVRVGDFLVPLEETESPVGKDLGYDVDPDNLKGMDGSFLFLQNDFAIIASGQWALTDLGAERGMRVGDQVLIFREKKDTPPTAIGNAVVIDVQNRTSTVKILSCRDAVIIGDRLRTRGPAD